MSESAVPQPLELHRERVLPEWTDYNGHMNLAYFLVAFDHATDAFFDHLDLGRAYRLRTNCSLFTLEAHVSYAHELNAGDPLRLSTQLVAFDAKRLHYFHRMYHAEEGFLAASNELLSIHVDLETRRSSAMPAEAQARLERLLAEHRRLPRPPELGRVIALPRKG
ncbi:MAG TPA: thioesterase family protein [Alphaproteobacteria bacterium]|nr:thioesterase family protein [Alphaproteobacteria bacterium]